MAVCFEATEPVVLLLNGGTCDGFFGCEALVLSLKVQVAGAASQRRQQYLLALLFAQQLSLCLLVRSSGYGFSNQLLENRYQPS